MPFCAFCGTPVDAVSYAPCPSCGRPRNGAPQPAVKGGTNAVTIVIVVLAVVLVVVAIMGIFAAIAIPNLLTAMQRSKQKRTMADIRTVATAVEAYATDNKKYPDDVEKVVPTYIKVLPRVDGWGHPIRYLCWNSEGGTDCTSYAIGSAGKDGQFEHDDLKEYLNSGGATTNFNADIVYSDGKFIEYPQGMVQ